MSGPEDRRQKEARGRARRRSPWPARSPRPTASSPRAAAPPAPAAPVPVAGTTGLPARHAGHLLLRQRAVPDALQRQPDRPAGHVRGHAGHRTDDHHPDRRHRPLRRRHRRLRLGHHGQALGRLRRAGSGSAGSRLLLRNRRRPAQRPAHHAPAAATVHRHAGHAQHLLRAEPVRLRLDDHRWPGHGSDHDLDRHAHRRALHRDGRAPLVVPDAGHVRDHVVHPQVHRLGSDISTPPATIPSLRA